MSVQQVVIGALSTNFIKNLDNNEVVAARNGAADLDTRLDAISIGGSNVATLLTSAAAAAQRVVNITSSAGFVEGAACAYPLAGGQIEYNEVDTINSGTQITLLNTIGTGGIADGSIFSQVPLGTAEIAGNYNTPADRLAGIDQLPNAARLGAQAAATATTLTTRTALESAVAGLWVAINVGTTSCEIRRINSVAGTTVNLHSALDNTHAVDTPVLLLPTGPVHNVAFFGANANSADNTTAIQAAVDSAMSLGRGEVLIDDIYQIASPVTALNALYLEIRAVKQGGLTAVGGAWNNTKAMLNMAGASSCVVNGLRLTHTLTGASAPAAGIVTGRGSVHTGGSNSFVDVFIDGEFQSACFYSAAAEVQKLYNCDFIQKNINPCYFNSSFDPDSLCTGGTFPNSNTRHHLLSCEFKNYSATASQKVVELNGQVSETVLDGCYLVLTEAGWAIDLTNGASGNSINRLRVNNARVEDGSFANARFLRHNNSGGLNHSWFSGIVWTITSDYLFELSQGGTGNYFHVTDKGSASKPFHFTAGQIQYSQFVLVSSQMEVASGATPSLNTILSFNQQDVFTGAGEGGIDLSIYKANKITAISASGSHETMYNTEHEWLVVTDHTAGFFSIVGKKRVEVDFASAGGLSGFTNGKEGQIIILYFTNGNCTVQHASSGANNLRLNGSANFAAAAGDTLTIIKNRSDGWSEISRMVR